MVRILGNNLSVRKKVYIALTAIYGIGIPTALRMLKEINMTNCEQLFTIFDHTRPIIAQFQPLLMTTSFKNCRPMFDKFRPMLDNFRPLSTIFQQFPNHV